MFYSQFILAKKGPLGTIWIAAHLERKLRKNQVADTDIGVSVDSILFPEVPIALRLSSHLLLGVVRIYSRKVNYLFDDCSEALLKIKQAFRSTAVDLPPEESTAPYHSITLPETFDLDDFELPDNDIFQGNYVDHHVSTREQITLQDTMEGVVYSTSQFGLDERFGDGDTSQAGLDLEEDLLLEKVTETRHDEVSENHDQTQTEQVPYPKETSNGMVIGSAEDMPLNGTRNKIEDADLDVIDYAEAPCTPGLAEEPNVSSVKDGLASDDHLESEDHNPRLVGSDGSEDVPSKSDLPHKFNGMDLSSGDQLNQDNMVCTPAGENHFSGDMEANQSRLDGNLHSNSFSTDQIVADGISVEQDGLHKLEYSDKVVLHNNEQTLSPMDQVNKECEVYVGDRLQETEGVSNSNNMEESHLSEKNVASNNVEDQSREVHENIEISNGHANVEQMAPTSDAVLRACNADLSQTDIPLSSHTVEAEEGFHVSVTSTKVQGQEYHANDVVRSENQMSQPSLGGEICIDGEKQDEQPGKTVSNEIQFENVNSPMTELPAPETLLSVPQRLLDEPQDLVVETPDKEVQVLDDGGAETKITGKKRSFTESSFTLESVQQSVEPFGATRSEKTAVDSIPDDDDLLSSILVGRRSSVLKLKPTPTAPEAPPMKRSRTATRPSALKRKLVVDDSMVLHGDTIRQQLINTEDIRRMRKKAPCSHTEILMIQRQFLEEEIFSEPVLTGMSAELAHLHNVDFDLSRIVVSADINNVNSEVVNDEDSAKQFVNQDNEIQGGLEETGLPSDFPIQSGNQQVDGSHDIDIENQAHVTGMTDTAACRTSEHENLGEKGEIEIDKSSSELPDATIHPDLGLEMSLREELPGEFHEMLTASVDQPDVNDKTFGVDDCMEIDTLNLSTDKIDTQLVEEDALLRDISDGREHCTEQTTEVGVELEMLLEESKVVASIEVGADVQVDGSAAPSDVAAGSLANLPDETGVNFNQASEGIENDKEEVRCEDGELAVSSACIDDKDQTSNHLSNEESKADTTFAEGDFKSDAVDGDGLHRSMDAENVPSSEHPTTREYGDFPDDAFANDTDFLNVDDEEVGEDGEDGVPDAADASLLDNTGWSSRTRAVAKYLQTLFVKEAGQGRKALPMDNLLLGKTRKEASRMFFETLVLKTRDYVQVEQAKPFDNINIKPRSKLLKSEF